MIWVNGISQDLCKYRSSVYPARCSTQIRYSTETASVCVSPTSSALVASYLPAYAERFTCSLVNELNWFFMIRRV